MSNNEVDKSPRFLQGGQDYINYVLDHDLVEFDLQPESDEDDLQLAIMYKEQNEKFLKDYDNDRLVLVEKLKEYKLLLIVVQEKASKVLAEIVEAQDWIDYYEGQIKRIEREKPQIEYSLSLLQK